VRSRFPWIHDLRHTFASYAVAKGYSLPVVQRLLHLPIAIVHKTRISGEEVRVRGIVGDVSGRTPVIIDDMISTGGTIDAACKA
jgi:adenine/guanine phosphoribosyltransferase-like PRPP-binding protein